MAYDIRPATAADQAAITALIRRTGINPTGLHWPRFLVTEDRGRIIGVGQMKPHGDGSRELASIAVAPDRRGEGIAAAVIETLLARETGTVYLMCADHLAGFYPRFGFTPIERAAMPPYFRRIARAAGVLQHIAALFGRRRRLLVMRR